MADNRKAEEYLTEVMKRVSGGKYDGEERSADNIAIPDEKDLHNLEDVESAFESMGDEEFLEMLIRINEQMEEKNMIPPEFSAKNKAKNEPKTVPLFQEEKQKAAEKEKEKEGNKESVSELKIEEPEELMSELDMKLDGELLEEAAAISEGEEGGTEETLGTKFNEESDDLGLSNIIDFDSEFSEEEDLQNQQLKNITESNDEDLMASLDSIVQEIQDESPMAVSEQQEIETETFGGEYDRIAFEDQEDVSEEEPSEAEEALDITPKKKKKEKKAAAKKKNSFGQKVKSLFFRVEVVQPLTEEEEQQQKELKQQEKQAKKAAAAEEKKKKAAEKKEAAKLKKEEAAAKKAEKPKKEKKPKPPKEPVSPEEILHIRPMFLVFLVSVAAAIVLSTITLSDTFGYRLAVQEARNELENGHYEEAFELLNGLKITESDMQLYESVRILMRVEKQYRSYVNYSLMDMPNEALNSLVKAVENYDKYLDIAENYGIKEELDALLSNVEYALGTYNLNLATVREWNTLEDTNEYTKRIMACTGSY